MSKTFIRGTAIGTFSALALAVAGQASAVSFDAGNTKVTLSGYIKGDLIYDVDQDLGDTFASRSITTGTSDSTAHFRAHGRQTRLHFATSTPTDNGTVTTMIQGDFFGDGGSETVSNSRGFRVRHVWGEYNGIGFGQTWSNFMPLVALPPTLDFAGPSGYVFNRQGQARYTMKTDTGAFSVALENPHAQIAGTTDDNDPAPDITVRYAGNANGVKYSASGVVTFLETEGGASDDSATGFGAIIAASTKTDGGTTIGGNIGYFDGANRYLWQGGGGGFNNAFIDANGDIDTVGEIALMGFIDQALSDKTNAMLAIGYAKLDDDASAVATSGVAEKFTSVHANIRHSPVKSVTFGVEVAYAEKEMFNGADGDNTRIQVSGQYKF